jgi:hypothetical protein
METVTNEFAKLHMDSSKIIQVVVYFGSGDCVTRYTFDDGKSAMAWILDSKRWPTQIYIQFGTEIHSEPFLNFLMDHQYRPSDLWETNEITYHRITS